MIEPLKKNIATPLSVIQTCGRAWNGRREQWKATGLDGTAGRSNALITFGPNHYRDGSDDRYTSKFDPVLVEHICRWFCPEGGKVLDPLCGGPTGGVVAGMLGHPYTGIDLREEQIEANEEQVREVFRGGGIIPRYLQGDAAEVMRGMKETFDLILTSPPFYNLARYTDDPENLCNRPTYADFLERLGQVLAEAARVLKTGGFLCLLTGDVRDRDGHYRGLVGDTVRMCRSLHLDFFNEIIVVQPYASAPMRSAMYMKRHKVPRVHLHLLVFGKQTERAERLRRSIAKMSRKYGRSEEELWEELNRM